MEQLKVNTTIHKTGDNDKILIRDIVNESISYSRNLGVDGTDIRLNNSSGEKAVDVSGFQGIEFLRLQAVWDETDEALEIIKGDPASFEIQFNESGFWLKQTRLTLENPDPISSLKVRNPDNVNNKYIKIKVIIGAKGV